MSLGARNSIQRYFEVDVVRRATGAKLLEDGFLSV